mgnify:CR=1 FL=1|tara:strand:+ start:89 stop:658 length:570 start_codon:yes stop_codon:yes gene_type:complete
MAICKFILISILSIFFFNIVQSKDNLGDISISAKDFIILKYELFLNKNLKRLYNGGGLQNPIVAYEFIDYQVKFDDKNNFSININAYMNKFRYSKQKKYIPKISDCNVVRNKILVNKMGYDFLSFKKNKSFNEEDLNNSLIDGVFNFPGLDENLIKKTINNTSISINLIHPVRKHSFKCKGKINQISLN